MKFLSHVKGISPSFPDQIDPALLTTKEYVDGEIGALSTNMFDATFRKGTALMNEYLNTLPVGGVYVQLEKYRATIGRGYPVNETGVLYYTYSVHTTEGWDHRFQTYIPKETQSIFVRQGIGGTWDDWREIGGGGDVDWEDISNVPIPATRWPTWSEVSNKPSAFTPVIAEGTNIGGIRGLSETTDDWYSHLTQRIRVDATGKVHLELHDTEDDYVDPAPIASMMGSMTEFMDLINSTVPVIVQHGTSANSYRPDAVMVIWLGSVEPLNAEDYDLWIGG